MPDTRRLRRIGREIQGGGRARRLQVARDGIVARGHHVGRPLGIVNLVVHHAAQRLVGGHLHLELELQLPARFIQEIRNAVLVFGDVHLAVGEIAGG